MKHKKTKAKGPKHPMAHAAEAGAVAGEVAGAVVGIAAGPPGAVAGMVIGGIAGSVVGEVLEREGRRTAAHDEQLDRQIGVAGGNLGAAAARAVPSRGTPSAASLGIGRDSGWPAEGPMQDLDDEA